MMDLPHDCVTLGTPQERLVALDFLQEYGTQEDIARLRVRLEVWDHPTLALNFPPTWLCRLPNGQMEYRW